MSTKKYFDDNALTYFWNAKIKPLFATKVDKELKTGSQSVYKVLSDNNFTDALKTKLEAIGSVMTYKGTVATYSALPTSGQIVGDVWNVTENGHNYAWSGTTWDDLGGDVDLSEYVKHSELIAITNSEIDTICTIS